MMDLIKTTIQSSNEKKKLNKNDNIDICMVIMNTWHGKLPSLFSYIE